jgi:hypothetical protein
MLSFTILDFVLTSALCYMGGLMTGLGFCAKYKETFLQRSKSVEDLKRYNHHNTPTMPVMATAPPLDDVISISVKK